MLFFLEVIIIDDDYDDNSFTDYDFLIVWL